MGDGEGAMGRGREALWTVCLVIAGGHFDLLWEFAWFKHILLRRKGLGMVSYSNMPQCPLQNENFLVWACTTGRRGSWN